MEWVVNNLDSILEVGAYVVAAASAVSNFTKTDTDNKIVGYVGAALNFLALNFRKKPDPRVAELEAKIAAMKAKK